MSPHPHIPKLPVDMRDALRMTVRDLMVASYAAGKHLNLYGAELPNPSGAIDTVVVIVAVGDHAKAMTNHVNYLKTMAESSPA